MKSKYIGTRIFLINGVEIEIELYAEINIEPFSYKSVKEYNLHFSKKHIDSFSFIVWNGEKTIIPLSTLVQKVLNVDLKTKEDYEKFIETFKDPYSEIQNKIDELEKVKNGLEDELKKLRNK